MEDLFEEVATACGTHGFAMYANALGPAHYGLASDPPITHILTIQVARMHVFGCSPVHIDHPISCRYFAFTHLSRAKEAA
ncbi:MAG: hypothetical protein ACR2PI_20490 [Hyphomicrobiaceae bacterium]